MSYQSAPPLDVPTISKVEAISTKLFLIYHMLDKYKNYVSSDVLGFETMPGGADVSLMIEICCQNRNKLATFTKKVVIAISPVLSNSITIADVVRYGRLPIDSSWALDVKYIVIKQETDILFFTVVYLESCLLHLCMELCHVSRGTTTVVRTVEDFACMVTSLIVRILKYQGLVDNIDLHLQSLEGLISDEDKMLALCHNMRSITASVFSLVGACGCKISDDVKCDVTVLRVPDFNIRGMSKGEIDVYFEKHYLVIEGVLSALDGFVTFGKRMTLPEEISVQEAFNKIESYGRRMQKMRDKLVADGKHMPVLRLNWTLPRPRIFGWIKQVVQVIADNWSLIAHAGTLICDMIEGSVEWDVPEIEGDSTIDFIRSAIDIAGEVVEIMEKFLFHKDRKFAGLNVVPADNSNVPAPRAMTPSDTFYGFWDVAKPAEIPSLERRVMHLAKWIFDTTYMKGGDLANEIVLLKQRFEGSSSVEFGAGAQKLSTLNFHLPDLVANLTNNVARDVLTLFNWRGNVQELLNGLIGEFTAERNRNNNMVQDVALLIARVNELWRFRDFINHPNHSDQSRVGFLESHVGTLVDRVNRLERALQGGGVPNTQPSSNQNILDNTLSERLVALEKSLLSIQQSVKEVFKSKEGIELRDEILGLITKFDAHVSNYTQELASIVRRLVQCEQKEGSVLDSTLLEKIDKAIRDALDGVVLAERLGNLYVKRDEFVALRNVIDQLEMFQKSFPPDLATAVSIMQGQIAEMNPANVNSGVNIKIMNLSDAVARLQTQISGGGVTGSSDVNIKIANLLDRVASLEASMGTNLTSRMTAVESQLTEVVAEYKKLDKLPDIIEDLRRKVESPVVRPLNFSEKGEGPPSCDLSPFDVEKSEGQATYGDLMFSVNNWNGRSISFEWLDPLCETEIDKVYKRKFLGEMANGVLSKLIQDWFDAKVVQNNEKMANFPMLRVDGNEILEQRGIRVVKPVVERVFVTTTEPVICMKQGRIPERKVLSDCLGYVVGKGRVWLTQAECFFLRLHTFISLWLLHAHPNVDYTAPWDKHRPDYVEAGKPNMYTVGQAGIDETAGGDAAIVNFEPHSKKGADYAAENSNDQVVVVSETVQEVDEQMVMIDLSERISKLHPTQKVMAAGRRPIPLTVASGTILMTFNMKDLYETRGPFSAMLPTVGMLPGCLEIHLKLNLSPLAGIGLLVGYAESGLNVLTYLDPALALALPHYLWNPACEDGVFFHFYPLGCMKKWHPSLLRGHPGVLFVISISSWHPAPKQAISFSWRLSYSTDVSKPLDMIDLSNMDGRLFREYVANVQFTASSGTTGKGVRVCFADSSAGLGLSLALWQSLLSMFQYWKGDLIFEIVRTSSPMVAATIGMAFATGSKSLHVDALYLQSLPHVEFTLGITQARMRIKFPSHLLGFYAPGERMGLNPEANFLDYLMVLWLLDSACGNDNAYEMHLWVSLVGIENLQVFGHNAGYPVSSYRFKQMNSNVKEVAGDSFNLSANSQLGYVYQVPAGIKTLGSTQGQDGVDWFHCLSWVPASDLAPRILNVREDFTVLNVYRMCIVRQDLDSSAQVVDSPFVRVLKTSCWAKGTLNFRIVWAVKKDVSVANFDSALRISLYNDEILSLRRWHAVTNTRCGERNFVVQVEGPFDGFYSQTYHNEVKKFAPHLAIEVVGKQFAYYEVYVRFQPNFMVAGSSSYVKADAITGIVANLPTSNIILQS